MTKRQKRLEAIRNNPRNVRFDDLVALLLSVGFACVRQSGSHAIYQHPSFPTDLVNLQASSDGKAKAYQVEQVLTVIDKWNLEVL